MTDFPVLYAKLLGAVTAYETAPAFALPLFFEPGDESRPYVQKTDEHGLIVGFEQIDANPQSILRLNVQLDRRVGDNALLAFHLDDQTIEVATRLELAPKLHFLLSDFRLEDKPFLRATIAQFCGDRDAEHLAEKQAIARFKNEEFRTYYKLEILVRGRIRDRLPPEARSLCFDLTENLDGLRITLPPNAQPSDADQLGKAVQDAHRDLAAILGRSELPYSIVRKPIDLHYPSIDTLFKGRKTFLDRLHASLTRPDGGAAAIAGTAVHGMGGVGKTRAAVEYAWAHRDDYYRSVPAGRRDPGQAAHVPSRPWRLRFACPPPRHPRKPSDSKPCWTGSTPIPPGC